MKFGLLMFGVVLIGGGLFVAFAGSMSDAPELGERYGRNGCIAAGIGLASVIAAIVLMVLS